MTEAALAAAVFAVGAAVQGAVGFGVNLVAAPLLVLLDDRYVPGPTIVASTVLNLLLVRREGRGAVDPAIRSAMGGQVVGAVGAGFVLASLPRTTLSLVFAACVLVAVAISLSGRHPRPTPRVLAGAGLAAGFMGTVSGIGGPPMALVYQRAEGPVLRATLARFFLVGSAISLPVLVAAGELGTDQLRATLVLVPGAVLGFLASGRLVRRLDRSSTRPWVLALSTAAAVAVLARELS